MKRSNSRAKYVLGGFVLAAIVATTTACGSDDKTDTDSQSADTVHAAAAAGHWRPLGEHLLRGFETPTPILTMAAPAA